MHVQLIVGAVLPADMLLIPHRHAVLGDKSWLAFPLSFNLHCFIKESRSDDSMLLSMPQIVRIYF